MKKLFSLLLALSLLLSAAAALADPIKVGLVSSSPSDSAHFEAGANDFGQTFTPENGFEYTALFTSDNAEQQDAARSLIAQGVQYLLISAVQSGGWDAVLAEARDAGVRVILFGRMIDCDPDLYAAAVVSDFARQGEIAVDWLQYSGLDEFNVIHIQGALGSTIQLGRSAALDHQFEAGAMTRVAQQSASWDEAEAKAFVESVIQSGKKFNVIYAESDIMARGAVAALDKAGITHGVNGDVVIVSFDSSAFALRELLAGNWNYDGQSNPYQAMIISFMIQAMEAGEDPSVFGLNEQKQLISDEAGFDAGNISEDVVDAFGLGE